MTSRRTATPAEISLTANKNCLVNLPPSLVGLLDSTKTLAQDCIVELQYRSSKLPQSSPLQSVFVGWSGLRSRSKTSLTSTRHSVREQPHVSTRGPTDTPTVELDSSFARTLNISDGSKAGIILHVNPHVAHTVHIEPLTPTDWDIIELHATFLETNLLTQIRALPNPQYTPQSSQKQDKADNKPHPLTIHLSPTSTANVIVTQLAPSVPRDVAFAKLGPDSEVIVAPKTRAVGQTKGDSKSIVSGSVRSGRTSGTHRQRAQRAEAKAPIFVRGVSERVCSELIVPDDIEITEHDFKKIGLLYVFVDAELQLTSKSIHAAEWVSVSVVEPTGLRPPMDAQQMQRIKDIDSSDAGPVATKVIARLIPWHSTVPRTCAVLSNYLCEALGSELLCGKVIRLEPAPPANTELYPVKIFPFAPSSAKQTEGLKFGGETRAGREAATVMLKSLMGKNSTLNVLGGPLTDGLLLPGSSDGLARNGWHGGILRLANAPMSADREKASASWIRVNQDSIDIDIQQEIPKPDDPRRGGSISEDAVPLDPPNLIDSDKHLEALEGHINHGSSALLCGGPGSGKTDVSKALAIKLRKEQLYNVTYFPCSKLVMDETHVSAIKGIFQRMFMQSVWGARLGGRSVLILDDLDKICPAEQELQVGNDNVRSRQISELLCTMARTYCNKASRVILVITARGKDSLHSVIVGGHVAPETVELKAPDKAKRRAILSSLLANQEYNSPASDLLNGSSNDQEHAQDMEQGLSPERQAEQRPEAKVDALDLAGRTDGYMPGDIILLFARARSEAMNRMILKSTSASSIVVEQRDFDGALEGFTPASLRNVTLQSSSTTFSAIGGLRETRKVLLETLQYPTTYAPIFAQCPLRLRSGLLLYGYPGCGKTLLASAVAGECGLNFISVKGPEILNKYIGASEKSVRDLFERAQAARPCVLFFDEFDSIAPKRGHDSTGVTDRVVNQLLTQMDGAEGLSGVYVLAATSRPDLIDPALLRPGRLDKSLLCDMPDQEDRLDILQALSTKLRLDTNITEGSTESPTSLYAVAKRTVGFSGADLQAVVYNAHLEAIHDALNDEAAINGSKDAGIAKTNKSPSKKHSVTSLLANTHDLIQFRFGLQEDKLATAAYKGSKALSERAALLARLDAQRLLRRREREVKRGVSDSNDRRPKDAGSFDTDTRDSSEIMIKWKHLEASLVTTRSSISLHERRKFEAIYNEFVQGRNGEMPTGQGPMEVGARSSLM